jgi:hypothetical protein
MSRVSDEKMLIPKPYLSRSGFPRPYSQGTPTGPKTAGPMPVSLSLSFGVPVCSPGGFRTWRTRCWRRKTTKIVHQTCPLRR